MRVMRGSLAHTWLQRRVRIVAHGAELQHRDDAVVEAVAALAVEHRAVAVELDGERDDQHRQREHDEQQPSRARGLARASRSARR